MQADNEPAQWINWARNQSFTPSKFIVPVDEDEAVSLMRREILARRPVRVVGGNHAFSPILETSGALFDLSKTERIISIDDAASEVLVSGGCRLSFLGAPLWQHGLALANQGDIDVQSVAGAIATGTKGSGITTGSISSVVNRLQILNGLGEVIEIDAATPELLRAGQVSLGLLGPVLRVGIRVAPAYQLQEEFRILDWKDLVDQWDDLLATHHHFSFWWMPTERSHEMYRLPVTPKDHCFIKLLKKLPADTPTPSVGNPVRIDRSYRIYPDGTTEAKFHEMEYMVDAKHARDAAQLIRELMLTKFPNDISPLQVRWQRGDHGYISPQGGRNSTSLSVSGEIGSDYFPFLRAVDHELLPFDARPHWGKVHFLTRDRAEKVYPDLDKFIRIRRSMDPHGLFLNPHLAELFS
ncbi:D-arabinono-1,4-lactone oxidase [Paraburkholderia sp. BCC1885]|uniref:D-arabinono-1,4-lactone oxidase n=1 Tax=Paraburkholderia sp. BCC1885 TaxID=2562669 RepID=UPI00118461DA|nr:D-arabinono-1,4-lactone oxidase [Paraburkholderia sp. BCC1885]